MGVAKILIAVPTYETIYPDTFKAIYDLDVAGVAPVFEFVRGYDVAQARNKIALRALEIGADYVLMIDNDVIPPRDALQNLLSHGVDVCLGAYAHRGSKNIYDGASCLCKLGEFNYTMQYSARELIDLAHGGEILEHIHGGGMGCALIKTDVFRRIAYPWFRWTCYDDKRQLSEDLYFCEQCRKNKIPIYADPRVRCGHIFRYIQDLEDIDDD